MLLEIIVDNNERHYAKLPTPFCQTVRSALAFQPRVTDVLTALPDNIVTVSISTSFNQNF